MVLGSAAGVVGAGRRGTAGRTAGESVEVDGTVPGAEAASGCFDRGPEVALAADYGVPPSSP